MNSTFNSQPSTDPEVVIRVENLYKEYRLGTISHGTLYRDLQSWWARLRGKEDPNSIISAVQFSTLNPQPSTGVSNQPSTLNSQPSSENPHMLALDNVSFEVKRGETLGIIGRNGAGKSTLLKILSEVTSPTKGTVKIKGRVASLLEVGTGFHPELTGRENVYLNGAILGMTKRKIEKKFDEIVDFAEIEKFIDTPVKRYSSGMYVRLAFAVAAHIEPEILIVDEVLAVGDAAFQKKCLGKMGDVAKEGRTVLFVSHNIEAVKNLCNRGIGLNDGQIFTDGHMAHVISQYMEKIEIDDKLSLISDDKRVLNSGRLHITRVWIENSSGELTNKLYFKQPFAIVIEFKIMSQVNEARIGVGINLSVGLRITTTHHTDGVLSPVTASSGSFRTSVRFHNAFMPGKYVVSVGAHEAVTGLGLEYVPHAISFIILSFSENDENRNMHNAGLVEIPALWEEIIQNV